MHVSRADPHVELELHLLHPPLLQFLIPTGVPLYPVATTRHSLTMIHPTLRFIPLVTAKIQLLRCEARLQSWIK